MATPSAKLSERGKGETAISWTVICVVVLLPFLGFWLTGLFDLDEGYYGAVTAEMNRRGEWIIPYFNGHPWFEKPILLYWFAKPCLLALGAELGPRVPSVLASLGTISVVIWFCRRRLSETTAKLSALILAGSILFVAVGRLMLTDPLLVFFLSSALFAFWESLVGDKRWRLAAAVCLGFAVLAKGPVALILFALVVAWTWYREPLLRARFRGYWLFGGLLCLGVIALWYFPVYLARPEGFVQEFLVRQNLARFAGGDEAHRIGLPLGLGYYIPIVLVGLLPWSLWIPRVLGNDGPMPEHASRRYLAAWALVVLGFFTLSSSKLPHYALASIPPLAILIADYFARNQRPPLKAACAWVIALAIIVNVGFWGWYEGWFPGTASQAEAHAIARSVQGRRGKIAVYQMTRRNKDLGTGGLRVQETSLPSLLMYLDQTVLDTDDFEEIASAPSNVWIITRAGRIGPRERAIAEADGKELIETTLGNYYSLYVLRPKSVRRAYGPPDDARANASAGLAP